MPYKTERSYVKPAATLEGFLANVTEEYNAIIEDIGKDLKQVDLVDFSDDGYLRVGFTYERTKEEEIKRLQNMLNYHSSTKKNAQNKINDILEKLDELRNND